MINPSHIPVQLHGFLTVVLCVLMVAAVSTDMRERRIKNSLVIMILLLGLVAQIALDPIAGLVFWATGLLVGLAMFLPFYAGGGMGAGDVKLMAVVTAFLGPVGGAFACATALIAGLPLAIAYMAGRYLRTHFAAPITVGVHSALSKAGSHGHRSKHGVTEKGIPYAASIAVGCVAGLWWMGRFEPMIGALLP